jgi:phage terminase large subunit GpA-like protein
VAWLAEFTEHVQWDDPRTVSDLAGTVPEMGRVFDEHTNVFRAIAESSDETDAPRRVAVAAAVAEVAGHLPPEERRHAESVLGYIRSGRAWLVLHDRYGLDGDQIVAALDWAATTLLDDLRRRNRAAAREKRRSASTA